MLYKNNVVQIVLKIDDCIILHYIAINLARIKSVDEKRTKYFLCRIKMLFEELYTIIIFLLRLLFVKGYLKSRICTKVSKNYDWL